MPATPGDWKIDTRHHVHAIVCQPTRPGEHPEIAFVETRGQPDAGSITARQRTDEELRANAYLMAAAPVMLEALQMFQRYAAENCNNWTTTWDMLERTVAGAIARTVPPEN